MRKQLHGDLEFEPKIIHAADIHLDSPLQKLSQYEGAPAEQIRRASRNALTKLVDLAIEESVDLLVIAGDLYDGDWPDQNTGLFSSGKLLGSLMRGYHWS